jgi:hypothetical protein
MQYQFGPALYNIVPVATYEAIFISSVVVAVTKHLNPRRTFLREVTSMS